MMNELKAYRVIFFLFPLLAMSMIKLFHLTVPLLYRFLVTTL